MLKFKIGISDKEGERMIRKLTSRKFWLSIASFVSMIMIYKGADENEATQIASIIMAGASIIGYLLAEGLADSKGGDDAGDRL